MGAVAEVATLTHGYTMADVDKIAWRAVRRSGVRAMDTSTAYGLAWHGIIECLYAEGDPPDSYELQVRGMTAVRRQRQADLRHYGYDRETGDERPAFVKFWLPVRTDRADGFTDRLVEAITLPQVLARLTVKQYEVIATLAAYDGDRDAAARALGMNKKAFEFQLYNARDVAAEAWFDDETPHTNRARAESPEVCRFGHSREEYAYEKGGQRRCQLCDRNAARRRRARHAGDPVLDVLELEDIGDDEDLGPLTFAPPRVVEDGEVLTAADICWCGLAYGHDWPHKTQGAPHPRGA